MLLLIVGLVIGYFSVVIPLQEAYSKAPKISLYFKFAFLSPALILLGILVIIVPSTLTDQSFMTRGHNKLSVAGWALVVVLLIIGFGTYYLLDQQINSLGYK
jgi:membrane-associated PAP2 superfamily phosphatase